MDTFHLSSGRCLLDPDPAGPEDRTDVSSQQTPEKKKHTCEDAETPAAAPPNVVSHMIEEAPLHVSALLARNTRLHPSSCPQSREVNPPLLARSYLHPPDVRHHPTFFDANQRLRAEISRLAAARAATSGPAEVGLCLRRWAGAGWWCERKLWFVRLHPPLRPHPAATGPIGASGCAERNWMMSR